jgi:hypothetical protein
MKRQRSSNNNGAITVTSLTTSKANHRQTSTRAPLLQVLLDTNAIPATRLLPTLMPKPKPSGTTKEVPTYDSDNTEEEDREHKALNDTAKDYFCIVMEAATFAHIPETGAHHFNESRRQCPDKANAPSAAATQEQLLKTIADTVKRKKQLDQQDIYRRLSMASLCMDFAHFM